MKRLAILAMALVLMVGAASAYELRQHPMTGEVVPAPVRDVPDGGQIVLHNYDWIPYTIEVHPHSARLVVRKGSGGGRRSVVLPPGARVYIPSQLAVWTMQGNTGRSISIGVRQGRKVDVDLIPDGDGRMIGLEVIVKDRGHRESQLLIARDNRDHNGWPQEPAPTPYIGAQPIPVIGQDPPPGYPVPVIVHPQPGYPVPVIGRDPPPPQYLPHVRY